MNQALVQRRIVVLRRPEKLTQLLGGFGAQLLSRVTAFQVDDLLRVRQVKVHLQSWQDHSWGHQRLFPPLQFPEDLTAHFHFNEPHTTL